MLGAKRNDFRPALESSSWRFLPQGGNVGRRTAAQPPEQSAQGLDLELQYSSYLEDTRRARLTRAQPSALSTAGWEPVARGLDVEMEGSGLDWGASELSKRTADPVVAALLREAAQAGGGSGGEGGHHDVRRSGRDRSEVDEGFFDEAEVDEEIDEPDERSTHAIIWRPAGAVRLATNVPAELLAPTAQQPQQPPQRPPPVASARGVRAVQPTTDAGRTPRLLRAAPLRPVWNRGAPVKPASDVQKLPFGAWYLPAAAWGKPAPLHDGDAAAALRHVLDPTELAAKGDSAADRKTAGLEGKLTSLYSSRSYKTYLQKAGARVPSYLQRVDTDQKKAQGRGKAAASRALGSPRSPRASPPPALGGLPAEPLTFALDE